MIDVFCDGVESGPGGSPDLGDFLTTTMFEEPEQLVANVLGPGSIPFFGIGDQGFEVARDLGVCRLMAGQEVKLTGQVVEVAGCDSENFAGLADLGRQVALVSNGDPFTLTLSVRHRQSVGTNHADRGEEDPETGTSIVASW